MNKKTIVTILAIAVSAILSMTAQAEQVKMTKEVQPYYPFEALKRMDTGWVLIEYSVDEEGRAENISVIESEPSRVFERAARKAISQSRFEVTTVDGEPVSVDKQYKKFVFEVEEDIPGGLASRSW